MTLFTKHFIFYMIRLQGETKCLVKKKDQRYHQDDGRFVSRLCLLALKPNHNLYLRLSFSVIFCSLESLHTFCNVQPYQPIRQCWCPTSLAKPKFCPRYVGQFHHKIGQVVRRKSSCTAHAFLNKHAHKVAPENTVNILRGTLHPSTLLPVSYNGQNQHENEHIKTDATNTIMLSTHKLFFSK